MFGKTKSQEIHTRENRSFAGRARMTKYYHKKQIAPITPLDDVNGAALEMIWKNQKGKCVCCSKKFATLQDASIDHIFSQGFFRVDNIQLICPEDNTMKRGLTLPFVEITRQYGKNFLQMVRKQPDVIRDMLRCDEKTWKRIVRWADRKG